MLRAQVLAENAVLARTLLEGVGVLARALGPRFAARGRLMYTGLIPLLERLADPCASVAGAAGAALGALCAHCGYFGLDQLVCLLRSTPHPGMRPCMGLCLRLVATAGREIII